jgi:hypothetical protein
LDPVSLPNVVDLKLEVFHSESLASILALHEAECFTVRLSEFYLPHAPKRITNNILDLFPKGLASHTGRLPEDLPFAKTIRIPYQDAVTCSLSVHLYPGIRLAGYDVFRQVGLKHLEIHRDRASTLRFEADAGGCLTGTVADHRGRPLAEAILSATIMRGTKPFPVSIKVSSTGRFLYFTDVPAENIVLTAEYWGCKATRKGPPLGRQDYQVRIDLSGRGMLRLHRGGKAMERYRLGTYPHLFGKKYLPRLPFKKKGLSYLPTWRIDPPEKKIALTWMEKGEYYEAAFKVSDDQVEKGMTIDLAEYDIRPCTWIDVDFGDRDNVLVRVTPAEPLTLARPQSLVAPGEDGKVRIHGIGHSRYLVRIIKSRAYPGEPPLARFHLTGSGTPLRVDVPGILSRQD